MKTRAERFAASELGEHVLSGRPMPDIVKSHRTLEVDLAWQEQATKCRDADETTSYVLVEAQYQDDLGEADLWPLCGQCPVAYECLTAGMRMRGSGVWGGLVLDDGRPAPARRHGKHSKAHLLRMAS